MIDEQIERWKAVNELEKRKEHLVEAVKSQSEQKTNFHINDSSDDEAELDYDKISWRSKVFWS